MADTFKDRLENEYKELFNKWDKLKEFLDTDTFKGLEALQRRLLIDQERVMDDYLNILAARITTNKKVEDDLDRDIASIVGDKLEGRG